MSIKLHRLLVLLVLFLLRTDAAPAALVAYEGFDYPTNTTIAGQSGGDGFTNAWTIGATGNFIGTNAAAGLIYTDVNGLSLQTNGGSLIVGVPRGDGATATPNRALPYNLSGGPGTTVGPGGTMWMSFLYRRLNFATGTLPYLRQANLGLFAGGGEVAAIGGPNTSATVSNVLSVWGNGAPHPGASPFQAPEYPINSNVTYFVLIKTVTDGTAAADNAYVWFNWTNLLMEPDVSTATIVESEVNLSSVNTLRFQAGNLNASGSNALFQVDEVRVGTTFADVAPSVGTLIGPSITFQPVDRVATIGAPASFSVTASGSVPLRYQWYFDGNTPLGSDTNWLTIANAQSNHIGGYHVVVSNSVGVVTSVVAMLTVVPPVPASIATHPVNETAIVGEPATFAVIAGGTAPLRYQWYFNTNTAVGGQTNAVLTLLGTTTNDAGSYSVIVTNAYGAATSTVAMLTVIPPFERLPAFPGADGAAKYVTGGRGGIVYHVTKLDRNYSHNEQGTLRYGLTDGNFPAGPRTIVFDVAGVFWLGLYGAERPEYDNGWDSQSRYNIPGNVTIAGQTAPGPVIVMGGVTKASSANVIVRNVMFAPGYGMRTFNEPDHVPPIVPTFGDTPDAILYDAVDISGQNIMLDHLTTIYGTDETISCNELAANLTIQFCTVAQGQNYPQGDAENPSAYGGHGFGSLLQAGSNAKISVINNLYAHLKGRLPRVGSEIGTGAFNDFRNNVFYNWLGTAGGGATGQPSFNNFINNFYIAGPGGDDVLGTNIVTAAGGTGIFNGQSAADTRAFVAGNLKDTNKDNDPNDTSSADGNYTSIAAQASAYDVNIGVTLGAAAGLTNVLRHVGARWWLRPYNFTLGNTNAITTNDIALYVDQRLIRETFTGTGKIMAWADDPFDTNANEGFEWRSLLALRADSNTYAAPFNRPLNWDTDGDGMPDGWEMAHGLNPSVANNNGDFDNDGYTDLEEYLNEIAAWPAPGVIIFNNTTNHRYTEIFNWSVSGATVNISGLGSVVTSSKWQPSRYDAALISNRTCVVDAVGQHAGILQLTSGAVLNVTNGWLSVADKCEINSGCALAVQAAGGLRVTNNLVNNGTLRLTGNAALLVGGSFTNTGVLDIMTWNGILLGNFVNLGTVLDRSLVRVSSFALNGSNAEVTIQGYAGHNYQLQGRDDLSSGAWTNIGVAVPGAGGPIGLIHSGGALAQRRFYRVEVFP